MNQRLSDSQQVLLNQIADALHRGGRLTEATLSYIETALFPPEPGRLASFLSNDADGERDTLLDLIFYPDQPTQVALEPLLEAARLDAHAARGLGEALAARPVHAPVRMPDGSRLLQILVPDDLKSRYLDRLNPTWQLDPDLAAAIDQHVSAGRRLPLKVKLRNTGRRFSSDQRAFLGRLVARMPDDDPDGDACLDLVLSILPASQERMDPYRLLVEHKQACFRSLRQARRFESLRQRSNMETLMLQGVRAPHASVDELMACMRLTDVICRHLFGRTEAIDPPMEAPVRRIADLEDTEAVFRSLLG